MPTKKIDETGKTYGRLKVINEAGRKNKCVLWRCRCSCGQEALVAGTDLRSRNVSSCGCLSKELTAARNIARCTRHGFSNHPLYKTHQNMINRCYNPKYHKYSNYGGRDIRVYGPWHDVSVFISWVEEDLGLRPEGMTLDRIENDGDYEPGNVRWADRKSQAKNQRRRWVLTLQEERIIHALRRTDE